MVDEAGQDPVEVEPAADVAGHPAQRLGPMEQVGDLLLASDDADDGADRVGEDRREVVIERLEAVRQARRRPAATPHGPSRPGIAAASSSRSPGRTVAVTRSPLIGDPRRARRAPIVDRAGAAPVAASRARPRTPKTSGRRADAAGRRPGGTATARRRQSIVAALPDRDQSPGRRRHGRGPRPCPGRPRASSGRTAHERSRRGAPGRGGGAPRRSCRGAAPDRPGRAAGEPGPAGGGPLPPRRCRAESAGALLGDREEPLEVTQPIAPIAPRVDAVEAQTSGVAPGADRVRMHAEQPRGLGDGECRVDRARGQVGAHRLDGGTVKSTWPRLPISQFLPIVRRSRRSRCSARDPAIRLRRPPVRRTYTTVAIAAPRPITSTSTMASQGIADEPGPSPLLRGSPPRTADGDGVAARAGRVSAPATAHARPTVIAISPIARAMTAISGRRGASRREHPHRLVAFEGREDRAGGRDRQSYGPCRSPGRSPARPARWRARPTTPARPAGAAATSAACRAGRGRARRPPSRRTRAGRRRARPSSASWSMAIASRPSRTSKSTACRCSSIVAQPRPSAELDRGPDAGRAGGARRPRTRPRRRSGRGSRRTAAARRPARAPRPPARRASPRGADRRGSAARSERRIATPTPSATRPTTIRSRGVTAATIPARPGGRTWKGPKEPPRHVGVDAIAAVSIVRPLRADRYATGAASTRSTAVVHECGARRAGLSTAVHIGQAVDGRPRSGRRPAGRRVQGVELAVEPGQDQPPADELGGGDDVRVGDPPRRPSRPARGRTSRSRPGR